MKLSLGFSNVPLLGFTTTFWGKNSRHRGLGQILRFEIKIPAQGTSANFAIWKIKFPQKVVVKHKKRHILSPRKETWNFLKKKLGKMTLKEFWCGILGVERKRWNLLEILLGSLLLIKKKNGGLPVPPSSFLRWKILMWLHLNNFETNFFGFSVKNKS